MARSQAVRENDQWSFTGTPAVLYGHKYNLPKWVSGELTKFSDSAVIKAGRLEKNYWEITGD